MTLNYTQQKKLLSLYNTDDTSWNTFFGCSDTSHSTLCIARAENETAAIEIFPKAHQKKRRNIV